MSTITFTLTFHEPFLVRSGLSAVGLDGIARLDALVPASSVKGAMRAACENVLGVGPDILAAVFGQKGNRLAGHSGRGAWAWTDPGPDGAFEIQPRARNRIDHDSGMVRPEALAFTQECWQRPGAAVTFDIEQTVHLERQQVEQHRVVLQTAAYAVTALGSWRNRGMGTVTIRPRDPVEGLAARWAQVTA